MSGSFVLFFHADRSVPLFPSGLFLPHLLTIENMDGPQTYETRILARLGSRVRSISLNAQTVNRALCAFPAVEFARLVLDS
jgi:hypothetical protein